MPPKTRTVQAEPEAPAPQQVFTHTQIVARPMPGAQVRPGPSTAAEAYALASGYRPTGSAYVEKIEDHPVDAAYQVVTWTVPAVPNVSRPAG